MENEKIYSIINSVVEELCKKNGEQILSHRTHHNMPMPSIDSLNELMLQIKKVLFPGFFGHSEVKTETINYYIGANLDMVYRNLSEQVKRGFCFDCAGIESNCIDCEINASRIASDFIIAIPRIKHLLSTDVIAAFNGDPAAKSYGEAIFCYPSITALTYHRVSHELFNMNVPLIPRIISEIAHSLTGIDIHPGATIGEYFFIDHGTGVVIGETSIIGNNVRLYQGVTLGAKSFPLDENGKPIKGIPRHPVVKDNVIIYSNSTILGRITIGSGAIIGGNMWITEDVEEGAKILQK